MMPNYPKFWAPDGPKSCPDCAEEIKWEARVCRFCGYRYEASVVTAAYDEIINANATAAGPDERMRVAEALLGKGRRLTEAGLGQEAIAAFDELLARFAHAPESAIREQVIDGLWDQGMVFHRLNQTGEGVAAWDKIVALYLDDPDPAIQVRLCQEYVGKGFRLKNAKEFSAAQAIYDDAVARYAAVPDARIRRLAVRALLGKSIAFKEAGEPAATIAAAWKEAQERFSDDADLHQEMESFAAYQEQEAQLALHQPAGPLATAISVPLTARPLSAAPSSDDRSYAALFAVSPLAWAIKKTWNGKPRR